MGTEGRKPRKAIRFLQLLCQQRYTSSAHVHSPSTTFLWTSSVVVRVSSIRSAEQQEERDHVGIRKRGGHGSLRRRVG